ncbi:MAG: DUF456 domain-containing protein [Actinomycetota bacterium]|nr:DUF456 domain-containing protein [Actinomycetota bacterium]
MSADTFLVVLVAVVMVIGVAGTVLPILPGLWVIWAAAVAYGILAGFGTGGWVAMALITILAIAGTASALYLPQRSAASVGVPWWGQLIALGFAVAGFFIVPVVGAPLGFVLGILLATVVRERHLAGALNATWATLKSMLLASGVQFAIGLMMMAIWVMWVWVA